MGGLMTGRRIVLRGFALDKTGQRVVRSTKHLDVSARLRMKGSKKVRVVKRGKAT
jgi:hypothetical protein